MAINQPTYDALKKDYGYFASWAIWDPKVDSLPGQKDMPIMRTDIAFAGLNATRQTPVLWQAFHIPGTHDRVFRAIAYQANVKGAYITDLFKGPVNGKYNPKSSEIRDYFNDSSKLSELISRGDEFLDELKSLNGLETVYVFGVVAFALIKKYLKQKKIKVTKVSDIEFKANNYTFILLYHYSYNRFKSKKTPHIQSEKDLIDIDASRIKP